MLTALRLSLAIVIVMLAGLVSRGAGADGDKPAGATTKPSVIAGWGEIVDVDGDCSVQGNAEKLTISVPNTLHSLSSTISQNAPRVLQDIEGDFIASVKVSGDFVPGEEATKPSGYPFIGAGLLIWGDEKNYIRLERNVWWNPDEQEHFSYPPLFQYFKGGVEQPNICPDGTNVPFFQGRFTYFRLARHGDRITASYSHDGTQWTEVKKITAELPRKLKVGVAAINSSNKAFQIEFTDLKVEAVVRAKPDDGRL